MKLSYTNILGSGEYHIVEAKITTDHAASSYGQPVIVLENGSLVDAETWLLLDYHIVESSKDEMSLLLKWLNMVYATLPQELVATVFQAIQE